MSEQIFISYRRDGGDVTAKLVCEAIKNLGFTVFYDYDSINGGYFDSRILDAIESCNDFVLVLPPHSLDRCVHEDDWVRQEIHHALKHKKNIIPVMLPGFTFPKDLPEEISDIVRFNGVQFVMAYFDSVMAAIVDRLITPRPIKIAAPVATEPQASEGLGYQLSEDKKGYLVSLGNCTDTDIIVPRLHNGKLVVGIADSGFKDYKGLTSITLPGSITTIGKSAFSGCEGLSSITLPDSLLSIAAWAFAECALTHIMIPANTRRVADRVFWRCNALSYIDVEPENNYVCSVGGHLFTKDMKKLISYAVGNWASDYTIPDGVTTIEESAFNGCAHLCTITIPESVTMIGDYAFNACTSLERIVLPSGITELYENTFADCSALTSVTLPSRLRILQKSVFCDCTALEYITLPDTLTSIGQWCFEDCAFSRIRIPASVTLIEPRAFLRCENLKRFEVDPENGSYCSKDGHLYTKDGKTLLAYAVGSDAESYTVPAGVTHIETSAFSRSKNLRKLHLPESFQSMGEFAFSRCTALESITIPSGVKSLASCCFQDCSALQQVRLSKGLTDIENDAFRDCTALTSIELPNSLVNLGEGVFNGCTKLSDITIPGGVTQLQKWVFDACALTSIVIPKNITQIAPRAFLKCSSMQEFKVSFWNRAYRTQNGHLFTKDMTTLVAYANGKADTSYVIPDGVKTIEDSAASRNAFLRNLTIADSVESIGEFAFYSCSALTNIHYKGTMQMWSSINIEKNSFKKAGTNVVHCTDGDVKL